MVAGVTVRLDPRGLDRVRLLVWELRTLQHDMRVGANPEAERLENIVDRFMTDLRDDAKDVRKREGGEA